jgi:hypothetical protein
VFGERGSSAQTAFIKSGVEMPMSPAAIKTSMMRDLRGGK